VINSRLNQASDGWISAARPMYSSIKGWPMMEGDVVRFQSLLKTQRYELHSNTFLINSSSVFTLKSSVIVKYPVGLRPK